MNSYYLDILDCCPKNIFDDDDGSSIKLLLNVFK
jgi:hypothetical protein